MISLSWLLLGQYLDSGFAEALLFWKNRRGKLKKQRLHKAVDLNTWDFFLLLVSFALCALRRKTMAVQSLGWKSKSCVMRLLQLSQYDSIVLLCPCPTFPINHNNQLTMQISQHVVWELFWLVCNLQRLHLLSSNEFFSHSCYFSLLLCVIRDTEIAVVIILVQRCL